MRILIVGAAGQLGRDLQDAFAEYNLLTPTHDELDVTYKAQVQAYIGDYKPEVVINTSAFHDVPKCEEEPVNAFSVNAAGTMNLAKACSDVNARFFHISTDYVFDGELGRPYREDDVPASLMIYGASKLAGEHLALSNCASTYIVRTTGLFGANPCRAKPGGRNFVDTMLHLAKEKGEVTVVDDLYCCPTYTPDLATQIATMIDCDIAAGIYHAVTSPGCSWFEFAAMIFRAADMDVALIPVGSEAFQDGFKRPPDSRLSCAALERLGIYQMRPLDVVLNEYLED